MKRFYKWIKNVFSEPDRESPSETKIKGLMKGASCFPDLPKLRTHYSRKPTDPDYILTVHTTDGWRNQSARSFFKYFIKKGYCTDFIDEKGGIYQQSDYNRSGYHAGKSSWKGKSSISRYGRGVEIACGGKLKEKNGETYTWFGQKIDSPRYVVGGNKVHKGFYQPMTTAQESALAKYLIYWCNQGVNPENIVSHDWIAYNRKSDIGGALSVHLSEFIKDKVIPNITKR